MLAVLFIFQGANFLCVFVQTLVLRDVLNFLCCRFDQNEVINNGDIDFEYYNMPCTHEMKCLYLLISAGGKLTFCVEMNSFCKNYVHEFATHFVIGSNTSMWLCPCTYICVSKHAGLFDFAPPSLFVYLTFVRPPKEMLVHPSLKKKHANTLVMHVSSSPLKHL